MSYAFEVHHKPEHDMKKPTPLLAALFMFRLLSLFEVVISKAIEQICLCSKEHAANVIQLFDSTKCFDSFSLFYFAVSEKKSIFAA